MHSRVLIRIAGALPAVFETGADAAAETVAFSHILRQAGAVMTYRGGQPVPAH